MRLLTLPARPGVRFQPSLARLRARFDLRTSASPATRLLAAALCTALLGAACVAPVAAQAVPAAPVSPSEPPLVTLDAAPPAPVLPAGPVSAAADPMQALPLTKQLLQLEQQSLELEAKRAGVRTLGYRIGKIVCWSASALFLFSAFGWYGTAQSVEKALNDGRDDEAYDVNGNHKVTKHDEDVARTAARTLAVVSVIPIGLGVFTTMMGMRREREKQEYSNQLEDLATKRRSLLRRLDTQLSAGPGHAALQLHLTF